MSEDQLEHQSTARSTMGGCYRCGNPGGNEAKLCPDCNNRKLNESAMMTERLSKGRQNDGIAREENQAAGFWLRVCAYLFDGGIISFLQSLILLVITIPLGGSIERALQRNLQMSASNQSLAWSIFSLSIVATTVQILIAVVIGFLYRPIFESSSFRATPGKLFMKLQVCTMEGEQISMARAIARELARSIYVVPLVVVLLVALATRKVPSGGTAVVAMIMSSIISLIQYPMVAFTASKQGLHDMAARTLVLMREDMHQVELGRKVGGAIAIAIAFGILSAAIDGRFDKLKLSAPSSQSQNRGD